MTVLFITFKRLSENEHLPSAEECPKCRRFNCFICNQAFDAEHTCDPTSKPDNSLEASSLNLKRLRNLFEIIQLLFLQFKSVVQSGDVVRCPKCHIYLEKQSAGCQLIRCYFCRMDICWLTKLPRWGPNVTFTNSSILLPPDSQPPCTLSGQR